MRPRILLEIVMSIEACGCGRGRGLLIPVKAENSRATFRNMWIKRCDRGSDSRQCSPFYFQSGNKCDISNACFEVAVS